MERTDHLRHHGLALASAAERLAESAGDRSGAADLPAALESVARALEALDRACESAALSIVPVNDRYEPASLRFARAADHWPGARGARRPSHERQALVLSALDELAGSLRLARRRAVRAGDLLQATMDSQPRAHAAFAASA